MIQDLPIDLLLYICEYLKLKDSISLLQTCRPIYECLNEKAFWVQLALRIQKYRPLPLITTFESLDSEQTRSLVLNALRLDHKWSGNGDPSPVRSFDLTCSPREAVSWAWPLSDGVHMVVVVAQSTIQIWNLDTRSMCVSFPSPGRPFSANTYIEVDLIVLGIALTVDLEDNKYSQEHYLWSYNPSSGELMVLDVSRSDGPVNSNFVTSELAGFIYDRGKLLAIQAVNWRTGKSFKGVTSINSQDRVCVFHGDTLSILYEATLWIEVDTIHLSSLKALIEGGEDVQINSDGVFSMDFEGPIDGGLPVGGHWTTWAIDLWDGRLAVASYINKANVNGQRETLWCSGNLDAILSNKDPHKLTFTRPIVFTRDQALTSLSPSNLLLTSGTTGLKYMSWAVPFPNDPSRRRIESIALMPMNEISIPNGQPVSKSEYLTDVPTKSVGNLVFIPAKEWIPDVDSIHDIGLDDRKGRLVISWGDGNIRVLEFV